MHIQGLFNQDKVVEPIDFTGLFATFLSSKNVVWEYYFEILSDGEKLS